MASDEALRRRQVAHNAALLRQVQDAALRSQVPLSRPDQNVSRWAHFGIPGPTNELVGCFSAEKVGCTFTELYYRVLYQRPEDLHEFYMDSSVAGWEGKDGVVHSVTTLKGINDMIMSSDYKDSSMELKSVYAQNSLEGHIILVVTGNLTRKDGLTRTFSHTFLLERHKRRFPYMNPSSSESEKNGIFILNDILRFPNTHPSTHESQNWSVLEASEAPSSTNSGTLWDFNAGANGITVEYEDCYKALKLLCGCSLQLKRAVEGLSVVDYVLTWKRKRVLEGGGPTFFSPPLKKPCLVAEKLDTEMTGRYSAKNVGCTFTEEYYKVLHQRPKDTCQFYMDLSVADWEGKDGVVHSVTTIKRINDMIMSWDYKDSDIEVNSFYAQNSFQGSILLVVTGNLTGKDGVTRTFSHTFHLARKKTRIFVLSDILRFLHTHPSTSEAENGSVLKASEVPSSNNSVNEETSRNAPVQISKAIPLIQFPSPPDSVKVDEDLSLSMVPRVKLNFTYAGMGSHFRGMMDVWTLKSHITSLLHCCKVCYKPLTVPLDDIHVHIVSPYEWTENDQGEEMWVVADGYIYFRDQRIICKEFHVGLRNFVLKKLSTANKFRVMDDTYQITLTLPPEEDPDQMMASLSNTLQTADNPDPSTLIIKGLPQWFVEQPASLRIFLQTMGVVRGFDDGDDGISVEYEDFYKALNSLCGCSLQLERIVAGPSLIDYVLSWKGMRVCNDDDPTFISPLLKMNKKYRGPFILQ